MEEEVCYQEELAGRGWGRSWVWGLDWDRDRTRDWCGMGRIGAEAGVRGQGGTEDEAGAAARSILFPSLPPALTPVLCSLLHTLPWAAAKSGHGWAGSELSKEDTPGTGPPATWLLTLHFQKHPEALRVLT